MEKLKEKQTFKKGNKKKLSRKILKKY